MQLLPKVLEKLIDELGSLPGVGPRTAERYAYHLLKSDRHIAERLSKAISELHEGVKYCPVTFALIDADQDVSPLYSDTDRNKKIIAVVEDPLDIVALERTGHFQGTYHVLGGVISPIDNIGPEQLRIKELIDRTKKDKAEELILAMNASVEGESTALFLQKELEDAKVKAKITRIARGLPVGIDLEYADQITLSHALDDRKEL